MRKFDTNEKPKITKDILSRILNFFKPYKKHLLLSIVAILIISLLGLAPPILLQKIVDIALPSKDFTLLLIYIGLSLLATLSLNLLEVGQSYINMIISNNIIFNMKNDMYSHLQYMSLEFFSTEKSGEIMTRMSSDIDGVQDVFNSTFVTLVNNSFTLITTLVALFTMNWKLALVAIATIPIYLIPAKKVGNIRWDIVKERQDKLSNLNQHIQETLSISGSTLMKIFVTEEEEFDEFESSNKNVVDLQIREGITGRWFRMLIHTLTELGPLMVYLFGGYLFIKDEISLGLILTFAALLSRLYRPVMQLSNLHIDTIRSLALFERIFEYFDKEKDIVDDLGAKDIIIENGDIEFKDVNFSYDNDNKVLENINFLAPAGKTTALVGHSGAGKSTITNLIPRLYDINKGEILIDKQNIKNVKIDSLRDSIGIVTQEPYLFNGSIRENLKYGNKKISNDEMITAAKDAYIHDFIMSLPDGYDSLVGNRGIKLSGGEKQRISIARVILKNPKILILDEATSALDSISEEYVQKAMKPLMNNRTSIVIAHRLSTIRDADQILVIDNGKISESGTHNELINKEGLYYELNKKQFKDMKIAS